MRNVMTNEPIKVNPNRVGSGNVQVPERQRPAVEAVLDAGRARYWLNSVFAMPGEEPIAWITFSANESLDRVQALLDEHP